MEWKINEKDLRKIEKGIKGMENKHKIQEIQPAER